MTKAGHIRRLQRTRARIDAARAQLTDDVRAALDAGLSLREVAAAIGYSHEQVRRIASGGA